MAVRPAAVADMFYPGNRAALERMIDDDLARVEVPDPAAPLPKAIIAPHAGYVYSGPIAASVYARLRPGRGEIRKVVLLGPAHRVYVDGLAVSRADAFATPLGLVKIDDEARDRVLQLPGVTLNDSAHAQEHSLEVHLPFLQRVLGEFLLLPLVVGDADPPTVARVLDEVWGGSETLVVVSTDLSHYHDYNTAKTLDQATAAAIVARRYDAIAPSDACGAHPVRGLLAAAEQRQLDVQLIDLRTSGDTAGDRDRVVGYGAFVVG
jgi:AmmeMemoRadiSam system protein B